MGAEKLREGQLIPISYKTIDGATNRFVRATIYRKDRSVFQGPITLTHNAKGEYKSNTDYFMPNSEHILVVFECFTDAGFTLPDGLNGEAEDLFVLDYSQLDSTKIEIELEVQNNQLDVEVETAEVEAVIAHIELNSVP